MSTTQHQNAAAEVIGLLIAAGFTNTKTTEYPAEIQVEAQTDDGGHRVIARIHGDPNPCWPVSKIASRVTLVAERCGLLNVWGDRSNIKRIYRLSREDGRLKSPILFASAANEMLISLKHAAEERARKEEEAKTAERTRAGVIAELAAGGLEMEGGTFSRVDNETTVEIRWDGQVDLRIKASAARVLEILEAIR